MVRFSAALDNDPDQMTGRARAYLFVTAFRHIAFGILCLAPAVSFGASRFGFINQTLAFTTNPIMAWGVLFIITGSLCFIAGATKKESLARSSLILSATTTSFWAVGLAATAVSGQLDAAGGSILFTALVAKDIIISRQPLRSPFEAVLRRARTRQQAFEHDQPLQAHDAEMRQHDEAVRTERFDVRKHDFDVRSHDTELRAAWIAKQESDEREAERARLAKGGE